MEPERLDLGFDLHEALADLPGQSLGPVAVFFRLAQRFGDVEAPLLEELPQRLAEEPDEERDEREEVQRLPEGVGKAEEGGRALRSAGKETREQRGRHQATFRPRA